MWITTSHCSISQFSSKYLLVHNSFYIMIAQKIKKYRKKKGISQDKLSKLAGVTYNTIIKIESGATLNPRVDTLRLIAKALGVTVDSLLSGK